MKPEIPHDQLAIKPEQLIPDALAEFYGERCADFDPSCIGCQAWRQYDGLVEAAGALTDLIPRFERCCEAAGSDREFIAEATKKHRTARDRVKGTVSAAATASNLNENNSISPPEPFDFENEGVHLAEEASQWSNDWCDYAELADKRLRAAYLAGLSAAMGASLYQAIWDVGLAVVPQQLTPSMLRAYKSAIKAYIQAIPETERPARWGHPRPNRGWKLSWREKAKARWSAMLAVHRQETKAG